MLSVERGEELWGKNMRQLLDVKKVLKALIVLALITTIVASSFEIMLVKGEPQTQPPTDEEKEIFRTKINRYKDLGQKSVKNITDSLGADGLGQWISIATKKCQHADYDSCEIIIKTKLVHFDCSIGPAEGDGKFGRESATVTIEGRVKKLKITFYLMINPDLARKAEESTAGQIDDDRLLYHELLHGQIKVDEMKDPNWAGWKMLCECKPLSEWGDMIGAGDPDHKVIPELEEDYIGRIARDRGYKLAVDRRVTNADENRDFSVDIEIPDDILEKETLAISWYVWKVEGVTFTKVGNKLTIRGKIEAGATKGKVWVYLDPSDVGMIIHVDISALLPVGGVVLPVDKSGLLAPYMGLASTIVVATVATAVYVKHVNRRKEKR
jgi:hypothetical protein